MKIRTHSWCSKPIWLFINCRKRNVEKCMATLFPFPHNVSNWGQRLFFLIFNIKVVHMTIFQHIHWKTWSLHNETPYVYAFGQRFYFRPKLLITQSLWLLVLYTLYTFVKLYTFKIFLYIFLCSEDIQDNNILLFEGLRMSKYREKIYIPFKHFKIWIVFVVNGSSESLSIAKTKFFQSLKDNK